MGSSPTTLLPLLLGTKNLETAAHDTGVLSIAVDMKVPATMALDMEVLDVEDKLHMQTQRLAASYIATVLLFHNC